VAKSDQGSRYLRQLTTIREEWLQSCGLSECGAAHTMHDQLGARCRAVGAVREHPNIEIAVTPADDRRVCVCRTHARFQTSGSMRPQPIWPCSDRSFARGAPVSHQKQPDGTQQTRSEANKNEARSTELIDIQPLITVWLQVRVLPGPPAFAREASEGCRAGAQRAKAGCAPRELRLGKPLRDHDRERQPQDRLALHQNIENNPMQSSNWSML
jgi:hypothetical protein